MKEMTTTQVISFFFPPETVCRRSGGIAPSLLHSTVPYIMACLEYAGEKKVANRSDIGIKSLYLTLIIYKL